MPSLRAPTEVLSSVGLDRARYAEVEKETGSEEEDLVRCTFRSDDEHVISWPELHYVVTAEVFADYHMENLQFIMQENEVVVGVRNENLSSPDLDRETPNPSLEICDKNDNVEVYCIHTADNRLHSLSYLHLWEVLNGIYLPYKWASLMPRVRCVKVYVWGKPEPEHPG